MDRNGEFAVFDAPNALWTVTSSINARGDVTGYFLDASQGKQRGFVRSLPHVCSQSGQRAPAEPQLASARGAAGCDIGGNDATKPRCFPWLASRK